MQDNELIIGDATQAKAEIYIREGPKGALVNLPSRGGPITNIHFK